MSDAVMVPRAWLLKVVDTLKPFAEVAEKLRHCHVVEICEPHPDNPSPNIAIMPREWLERAGDDLEAAVIVLHRDGALSEGQAAKLTGLDRVEVRKLSDALAAPPPSVSTGSRPQEAVPTCDGASVILDASQRQAIERAALDAGCHVWRRARLAMAEDGKVIGYPAFSRADMAELARLYREDQPADGCSSNERAGGWIEWSGGPNPLKPGDETYEYHHRDGSTSVGPWNRYLACWSDKTTQEEEDIIAYRIHPQTEKGS
jgi:hypothetical protein